MAVVSMKTGKLEWSVVSHPLTGESECGDHHVVKEHPQGILAGVVDGLGHGAEAAHAARLAVETLSKFPQESVISLVRRCHEQLTKTRGAVMSLASFYFGDDTVTWISIGNVEGVLARADGGLARNLTHIVQRGGVVGYQLPQLNASVLPIGRGDTMILATDGIRSEFYDDLHLRDTPERIALDIDGRFRKENDDSLALVIRYR